MTYLTVKPVTVMMKHFSSNYLLLLILLPLCWSHNRMRRGLWDQLPVYQTNNQYYSDITTSQHQLPVYNSNQDYSVIQLTENMNNKYDNIGFRGNMERIRERNNNHDISEDTFNRRHDVQGVSGFWGQMVQPGQKAANIGKNRQVQEKPWTGENIRPRHSNTKNVESKGINTDSRRRNTWRRVSEQKHATKNKFNHYNPNLKKKSKKVTPLPLRTIQTHQSEKIKNSEDYTDDYDYDYIYYDKEENSNAASKVQEQMSEQNENEILRAHRLNADTMKQLQASDRLPQRNIRKVDQSTFSRRSGSFSDSEDFEEIEEILGLSNKQIKPETEEKRLAAQINAVAVLDMIKTLQNEIKDINAEIEEENEKMKNLKGQNEMQQEDHKFEFKLNNDIQISTVDTMKELSLQREDTKMKKIIVQMMLMKQVQNKIEENHKLDIALQKLSERRKIINIALRKQKQISEEKRKLALEELERQKKLITEKEQRKSRLKKQDESKKKEILSKLKNIKKFSRYQPTTQKKHTDTFSQKNERLDAHKMLVDKSNQRILQRIQEIKQERQNEAVAEQERLLLDQQMAINVLRGVQKQRLKKQKESLKSRPAKLEPSHSKLVKTKKHKSHLLNFNLREKKKDFELLDLERNSAILEKTDKAIAEKIKLKNTALKSSRNNAQTAAQILLDSGNSLSDDELNKILGLTGLNVKDSNILGINNPSIIALEDPSALDLEEDYEYYDYYEDDEYYDDDKEDEYYDDDEDDEYYDYDEKYEYDYDDEVYENPEVKLEYEYDYEDVPVSTKKPIPKRRPHTNIHGHFLPVKHGLGQSSGSSFLREVSDLLGQAEDSLQDGELPHVAISGRLRNSLLRDVNEHVQTEVKRLPGGRVSTKVTIGGRSTSRPKPTVINRTPNKRKALKKDQKTNSQVSFSDLMGRGTQKPEGSQKMTFSQMMGELIKG